MSNAIHEDCSFGLHDYCTPCECSCHKEEKVRLLSDRIQEFIDWLEDNTDFGDWDNKVRTEVHKKLIECMISDPIEKTEETKNDKDA